MVIDETMKAARRFSKNRTGSLIVIEREVRLNNWIKKGVILDAEITAATLESIFTVPGPLHDGAVIISQEKIAAAAVILPITDREELGYVLGTRHRAAIGISEQSDAVVIVVFINSLDDWIGSFSKQFVNFILLDPVIILIIFNVI